MITTIILDVGGVYLQGSFVTFVNKAREILRVPGTFYADKEITFDTAYNKGEVGIEECFRRYFQVPISPIQMTQIIDIWTHSWILTDDMRDLIKELGKKYHLAILSNSDKTNSDEYIKRGWYDPFEVIILSHEVHMLKPDLSIYTVLLEKLHDKPENCVFVDDQVDNLRPAESLGMKTIHFTSAQDLKTQLNLISR